MNAPTTSLLLGAIAALFVACGGPNDPALVAEVERMIAGTDSMAAHHATIDITRFKERREVFREQQKPLEVFLKDTLDRDRAFLVGNYYKAMSKNLDRLLSNHARMGEELEFSARKLRDLKHDMAKGLLDPTLENTYLEQERMAYREMQRGMGVVDAAVELVDRIWDQSHEPIAALLSAEESAPTAP
jgi:hypothetical protein